MLRLFVRIDRLLTRLLGQDQGATMVEYALLVGLIALVAAVGAGAFGTELGTFFSNVAAWLSGKLPP
jgi:pilus assembly protein Flp/PilA